MPEQTSAKLQPQRIPRIIHQIWYQGESELPDKYRQFRVAWQRNHPAWQFVLWDEMKMREFVHKEYPRFKELFDGYSMNIQRIDSVRYFILNKLGGFYIDMDVENIKPIDDLLADHRLVLSKTVGYNNAIIGSVPNHPLWQSVLDNLQTYHRRPQPGLLEFHKRFTAYYESTSTGPLFFSRSVQEGMFDKQPDTLVCPGSFFEPDFPRETENGIVRSTDYSESYARHYGDLKWLPRAHRFISTISAQLFKVYWAVQSRRK